MNDLSAPLLRSFLFGPFVLVPEQQSLVRDGEPVRLGTRALALLSVLVEQAGELVGKQALIARVWPGAEVDESNLKVNMAALRRALGDADRYIATVTGRGYRFVAPVRAGTSPRRPTRDAPRAAHNLPIGSTRVFGRADAIASIADALETARLVSVVGPGGIGKTTVALAAAERIVGRFTDGVWLIDLAPLKDPLLVPHAIAAAIGVGVTSADLLATTCEFLLDRRMLLVLDSCEHVLEAATRCAERILAGAVDVRILATSREPLMADQEQVQRLPGLASPPEGSGLNAGDALRWPAVELFAERASERLEHYRLSDADAPLVADICRRLDGMALAIELAATRVDVFGVAGLFAQLSDRVAVPAGRRAGPERHRTLAATIDWSIGLLSPEDARFLRALAVFSGPFDAAGAGAVAAASTAEALAILTLLADKSLVATDIDDVHITYRLLETTRSHCLDQLLAHGETPMARQRHAEHVCLVLERAAAELARRPASDWGAAYGRMIDDLRGALDWTGGHARNRTLRIRLTLAGISLWNHFSLMEECRVRVSQVAGELESAGLAGTGFDMKLKLWLAGTTMFTEGLKPVAMDTLQQALRIAEQTGDTDCRLRCLMMIGVYEFFTGEHEAGLRTIEAFSALACAEDPTILPEGEVHLGIGELFLGRLPNARQRLEALRRRDLRYFASHGVRYHSDPKISLASVLTQVQWLTGSPDEARRTAEEAIDAARRGGHHLSLNNILSYACPVYYWSGDFDACAQVVAQLEEHVVRHGIASRRPLATFYRAALDGARQGPSAGVLDRLRASIDDFTRTNHLARLPYYLSVLAETRLRAGLVGEADAAIQRALAVAHEHNEGWALPEVLRVHAAILLAQDRRHEAGQRLLKSMAKAQGAGTLSWRLRAAIDLATLWRCGDKETVATAILQAVVDQFTEGSGTRDLRTATTLLDTLAATARPG
ncbi:ATP-binding protein [Piscinibacter gummiphilus]|uniref:ATPase n=1 Tax=Piscinibacter gummiphilus TaxID=946333 RepID=A0A1W6LB99_9BURK|nr:winged helix-turn-helix domain-containing protein [Piscinibacter gummiphilus]ARN21500.1 ATPase [Piscinibacter gummiphilus]ATU66184.1 ATPase [Piscinibacter gummiphilus]GLS96137.1 ATPase [Piscinibacter gummiphilus]